MTVYLNDQIAFAQSCVAGRYLDVGDIAFGIDAFYKDAFLALKLELGRDIRRRVSERKPERFRVLKFAVQWKFYRCRFIIAASALSSGRLQADRA